MFPENPTKRFFAQPRGHIGAEEMLKVTRRHPLKAIFQVMGVVVN